MGTGQSLTLPSARRCLLHNDAPNIRITGMTIGLFPLSTPVVCLDGIPDEGNEQYPNALAISLLYLYCGAHIRPPN